MSRARYLRKNATPAEQKLWRHLRNREIAGYKFRRQHPVGPYVLDFTVRQRGWRSRSTEVATAFLQGKNTTLRQAFLSESGIRVLRFYNREVYQEFDGVLQAIWSALEGCGKAVGR